MKAKSIYPAQNYCAAVVKMLNSRPYMLSNVFPFEQIRLIAMMINFN